MNEIEIEMSLTLKHRRDGWTGHITVGGADHPIGLSRPTVDEAFDWAIRVYDRMLEAAASELMCSQCDGSGLGLYGSMHCLACRGTGIDQPTEAE